MCLLRWDAILEHVMFGVLVFGLARALLSFDTCNDFVRSFLALILPFFVEMIIIFNCGYLLLWLSPLIIALLGYGLIVES
jgi:hypothetical protein